MSDELWWKEITMRDHPDVDLTHTEFSLYYGERQTGFTLKTESGRWGVTAELDFNLGPGDMDVDIRLFRRKIRDVSVDALKMMLLDEYPMWLSRVDNTLDRFKMQFAFNVKAAEAVGLLDVKER